jgi:putative addiction module component (TIGR02574 family)
MSTATLERLRSEILALPESERVYLTQALVQSLGGPGVADNADVWQQEMEKRIAQIDAGQARFLDRESFKDFMRTRAGND